MSATKPLVIGQKMDQTKPFPVEHGEAFVAELAQLIVEHTQHGVVVTNADGRIVMVNPAFEKVTGYSAEEVHGKNPRFLQSGRHSRQFYADMWQTLSGSGRWQGRIWNRRKNGEIYPEWLSIRAINPHGEACPYYVGVFADITELDHNDELMHLAFYDALTGLPNRTLLEDRLGLAVARCRRQGDSFGVLFADLDGFKGINDELGHLSGDSLLQMVAGRMTRCVRDCDTVARVGGDEFVLLVEDVHSSGAAKRVAAKLIRAISAPYTMNGAAVSVGLSIGVALYPAHANTVEELLRLADEAMYQAKTAGKGRFCLVGQPPTEHLSADPAN